MIIGVGTDIQHISKFNKNNTRLLNKLFTPSELLILNNKKTQSYVGYFCAKEATAKALGTGFNGFLPKDIEVIKSDNGKPSIVLHGKALEISKTLNISSINVSISHSDDYCVAFVVCESN